MGFVQGENERCCFYHEEKDLRVLLYVDDCLPDGDAADVQWIFTELEKRFRCTRDDMVTDLITQGYLGMVIRIEGDRIDMTLSTAKYIENACRILKIEGTPWAPTKQPIGTGSTVLSAKGKAGFLTAVGMLGWLAQTVRPRVDVSYTYSRIAQHSASPKESAMKAVRTAFAYRNQSKHYCISAQTYADDVDIVATLDKCSLEPEEWSFMVDADHAGNAEVQNRRRSQIGLIFKLN